MYLQSLIKVFSAGTKTCKFLLKLRHKRNAHFIAPSFPGHYHWCKKCLLSSLWSNPHYWSTYSVWEQGKFPNIMIMNCYWCKGLFIVGITTSTMKRNLFSWEDLESPGLSWDEYTWQVRYIRLRAWELNIPPLRENYSIRRYNFMLPRGISLVLHCDWKNMSQIGSTCKHKLATYAPFSALQLTITRL